jgi:hypothetical protein
MIKKIVNKIKKFFTPFKQELKDCAHENRASKTVKYCLECKLVLDES